jgi:hypothetical protein
MNVLRRICWLLETCSALRRKMTRRADDFAYGAADEMDKQELFETLKVV